jgi:hypothetical protein
MEEQFIDNSGKDVAHNWVSTSRFIWLCQIFLVLALIAGGCYGLYAHHYTGKPEVNVPDNTLYNPKYK